MAMKKTLLKLIKPVIAVESSLDNPPLILKRGEFVEAYSFGNLNPISREDALKDIDFPIIPPKNKGRKFYFVKGIGEGEWIGYVPVSYFTQIKSER